MKKLVVSIAVTGAALLYMAAPVKAEPGYGQDCIMPSVSECRLVPDADGPHDVEVYCPGQGYVNVFQVCRDAFGPYSPYGW